MSWLVAALFLLWTTSFFFVVISGAASARSYYSILGVDRGADEGQIKKQFRKVPVCPRVCLL